MRFIFDKDRIAFGVYSIKTGKGFELALTPPIGSKWYHYLGWPYRYEAEV